MDFVRQNGTVSSVHGFKSQLSKMKKDDWKGLFMLILAFIPGKVLKLINKNIWVVSEYENLARDNGFCFFRFLREKHKDIKAYYPLKKSSPDYKDIVKYGNVIEFGSFFHYMLFWGAHIYSGTTKCYGFPYRRICEDLVQWKLTSFKYVFLNHGFTRGYSAIVDAHETNYQLLVTCASLDSKIIINDNGQLASKVKCLGYARHDSLGDDILNPKQILVMPTWRNWLGNQLIVSSDEYQDIKSKFLASEYYRVFNELLHDTQLISMLEDKGFTLIFYLHEYAQKFSNLFSSTSDAIVIGTTNKFNIQQLLKESALLITDYSSVCYDFAYMYKPILYYQFDKECFEAHQYNEGKWFNYEENGFGEIAYDQETLLNLLARYLNSGNIMPDKYKKRVDSFFAYHDHDNCKRIFDEISRL